MDNTANQPQHSEVLDVYSPFMGAHAPIQDGDDGYPAQTMNAPYTYPPPVVPLPPPHPTVSIPDARPVRPDIIPPSLSRGAPGLRCSQRTLAPRAPTGQNTIPVTRAYTPQELALLGAAREMYPGSNSVQTRQRIAQRAARRTQVIAPYPSRPPAPIPPPENATVPSSSRVGQQRLPPVPQLSNRAHRNAPPAAPTPKHSETRRREYPCPIHCIVDENPGLYPKDTPPAEYCSRGSEPFTRACDSRRHFESEHLGVRYRMLRGPHRACGEFSRRDAILRHVRDCRKFPGALRVQGWLGIYMPCWNESGVHRACGVEYRRKLERDLGWGGMRVYACECCRVLDGEKLEAAEERGAREVEGTLVKIKEEEADETGALYLAGSQPQSEEAYESEEDAPCAVTTGEPLITPGVQASDGDNSNSYLSNDPWIGFCGEDNEAGTGSATSGSEHVIPDMGCSAAVHTEDISPCMPHPHALEGASSLSTPAHDLAEDFQTSPWEAPADPFANEGDSLFSDGGEYDDDAEGSDSEADAGPVECPQRHLSTAEPAEAQPVAHEDSPDVPLELGVATPTAVAGTSCGQSDATSSDAPGPLTPADADSQWGIFDFW